MFAVGLASYKIKPSQPTCFWIGPTPTEQLDRSGDIREHWPTLGLGRLGAGFEASLGMSPAARA